MGLLDVIDGNVTPTPSIPVAPTNSNLSSTFEDILREFDTPWHIGRGTIPLLRQMYQTLGGENQEVFGEILRKLSWSQSTTELQQYLIELNTVYQRYISENAAEIDRSRKILISAELVDEIDILSDPIDSVLSDSIMDKYEAAEALWDTAETPTSAENQLFAYIKETPISGTIDKYYVDAYFSDILSNRSLNASQQGLLEEEINNFKQNSEFYKQLEQGESIDLWEINSYLDEKVQSIINMPENGSFEIEIQWEPFIFHSKKEFLLAVYELKIQLAEMWPSWVMRVLSWVWETATNPLTGTVIVWLLGFAAIKWWYGYAKAVLKNTGDLLNQGIKSEDLERMVNSWKTGTLDTTIKIFKEAGYSDREIVSLINLQRRIGAITADLASESNPLRDQSRVYRNLARFRGMIGFGVSNLSPRSNPINTDKPFRSIPQLLVWSINKWPEGRFGWWQWQNQKEVINKYVDGFWRFNTVIENIDTVLKNPPHNLWENHRREIRKEILGVYMDRQNNPFRSNIVRPFRNRWKKVESIIGKEVELSGNLETFIRMLQWEIAPEIKSLIPDIQTRIARMPEISDDMEKEFLTKLRELQHIKTPWEFMVQLNSEISRLGITWIENHSQLLTIGIKDNEIYTTERLKSISDKIHTDIPNYNKVTSYLNNTTEWHKGLIIYNIARIISWEEAVKTLSLELSNKVLTETQFSGVGDSHLWNAIKSKYNEIKSLVTISSISRSGNGGKKTPGTLKDGVKSTEHATENINTIRGKARWFADRVILEAALSQKTNLFVDEWFLREVHKRIRNNISIDSTNFENETLKIIRDLVFERWGDVSKIAKTVWSVRILTRIQTDLQSRAIAESATADMQLRITESFKTTSSIRRLFQEEMRPGRILKFLL